MRFCCKTFFVTLLFSTNALIFCVEADAKSGKCGVGEFLFSTACRTCKAGCYCTGGNKTTYSFDPDDKISHEQAEQWCTRKIETCPKGSTSGYGDCGRPGSAEIYRCPEKYPNSATGAKSDAECYITCTSGKAKGMTFYNKTKVHCNKGSYLPAGGTSSSDCKSCNTINPATGAYCPEDGDYIPYCEDQGVKTCPAGKAPNTARTGCEDKVKCPDDFPYFKGGGQNTLERCYKKCSNGGTLDYKKIKCKKGEYLKGVSCKPCSELDPDAKEICPSDFEAYPECDGKIQSSKKCAPDETPNEDRTSCIGKEQSVPKGKYLRAKQDTPEPCPSGKYYCPGGDFRKEDKDQGKFQCPGKTKPNSEKSACMMVIEKEKMSLKKCWKQSSDPEKYKKCVFANTYYK